MEIKFVKTHPEAKEPTYATDGSNGLDLIAATLHYHQDYLEYDTGISVSIPEGYTGLVISRSSISKYPYILANSVGLIDADYTGSIKLRFRCVESPKFVIPAPYKPGDKIGQLVILPCPAISLIEVDKLDLTTRGSGGFGHSGNK